MRNRWFLIYQLTPPDLAFGQIPIRDLLFCIHEMSTGRSFIGVTHLGNSGDTKRAQLVVGSFGYCERRYTNVLCRLVPCGRV